MEFFPEVKVTTKTMSRPTIKWIVVLAQKGACNLCK